MSLSLAKHTAKREMAGHILVVDDEESLRVFAVDALTYGGFRAEAVDGSDAALKMLQTKSYQLVLTDFNMPGKSGVDLIGQMRAEGFLMPVILMTGNLLSKERLALAPMLNVGAILQKPFRIEVLLATVENLLRPARDLAAGLAHPAVITEANSGALRKPRKRRL